MKGHIDEIRTLSMNVLELKIVKFASYRKQSIERNVSVVSVVYFTGLNAELTDEGRVKFIDREALTIYE